MKESRGWSIVETKTSSAIGEEGKHGPMLCNGRDNKASRRLIMLIGRLRARQSEHTKSKTIWYF